MKFYIISGLWHSLIILSLFVFVKSPMPIIPRMDIKEEISINFTMAYNPNNNLPLVEKKEEIKKPIIPKKQKEEKKIIEEKKVEEIIEEKVELIEVLELKEEIPVIDETELVELEVVEEIIEEFKEEIIEVIEEELIEEIPVIDEIQEIIEDKVENTEIIQEKIVYEDENNKKIEHTNYDNNNLNKDNLQSENFIFKDNSYIAKNQDVQGLSYSFIRTPEPRYPNMARRAGIKDEVVIQVRFLVNEKGRVEEIIFYDNVTSYGFREEVTRALNNWQLSPVTIGDKVVKMYFYKVFRFNVK